MDSAFSWLKFAEEDLLWAEASFREGILRGSCFAAQQAVEKSLKAYLLSKNKVLVKIHDLVTLNEECTKIDPEFHNLIEACNLLSPYYLSSRYPDVAEFESYSKKTVEDVLDGAKKVVEFVKSKIII